MRHRGIIIALYADYITINSSVFIRARQKTEIKCPDIEASDSMQVIRCINYGINTLTGSIEYGGVPIVPPPSSP